MLVEVPTVAVAVLLWVPTNLSENEPETEGKFPLFKTHSQHWHRTSQECNNLPPSPKNSPVDRQNMQLSPYKTPRLDSIPPGPTPYLQSSHMSRLTHSSYQGSRWPNNWTCPSGKQSPFFPASLESVWHD